MVLTETQRLKRNAYMRAWTARNKERLCAAITPEKLDRKRQSCRRYMRLWRLAHPDLAKRKWKEYRTQHPDQIRENNKRAYARADKPAELVRLKKWRDANREHYKATCRAKYWLNPEASREMRRRWAARNPLAAHLMSRQSKARRRAREVSTRVDRIRYAEILKQNDGLCGICRTPLGTVDYEFDHIVPLAAGGEHTQANIQVAHKICNRRKGAKVA